MLVCNERSDGVRVSQRDEAPVHDDGGKSVEHDARRAVDVESLVHIVMPYGEPERDLTPLLVPLLETGCRRWELRHHRSSRHISDTVHPRLRGTSASLRTREEPPCCPGETLRLKLRQV